MVRRRRCFAALVATGCALLIPATASGASREITSTGPLERIIVNDTLGCQVFFTGADPGGQYFDGNADAFSCGTVLATGDVIYNFGEVVNSVPGDQYFFGSGTELFTPVSQSAVNGSGTGADPYWIVTVVAAGATGMRITETTTYVVGEERFRTDLRVENRGSAGQTAILYRYGDCFAGTQSNDRDDSSGVGTPGGGAACVQPVGDPNAPFALELFPLSAGSNFGAGLFDNSAGHIDLLEPLADVASPAPPDQNDSHQGLSWNITLPAATGVTCSLLITATDDPAGLPPHDPAVAGCLVEQLPIQPLLPAPPAGAPRAPAPTCKGKPATITGTEAADNLSGTPAADVMVGQGGNDKLSGLAGNDTICGGTGKDTLKGGSGNDKLFGEAGKDTLKGGPGKDKLNGGAGKDKQIQ